VEFLPRLLIDTHVLLSLSNRNPIGPYWNANGHIRAKDQKTDHFGAYVPKIGRNKIAQQVVNIWQKSVI